MTRITSKNLESNTSVSQSDSSQIGDEENFAIYQLEPKEEVLKKRETFEERQRLISTLKIALLCLTQQRAFEAKQRLQLIQTNIPVQGLLKEHKAYLEVESYQQNFGSEQNISQSDSSQIGDEENFAIYQLEPKEEVLKKRETFEERQRLISTLKIALLCLTQQRAFEAKQRLQLIQTNIPVQGLLKEHKAYLEVESYQQNLGSEQNISQSDSSQIGDKENFAIYQLEPKNDFNEKIISLIPKVSHSTLSSHEPVMVK